MGAGGASRVIATEVARRATNGCEIPASSTGVVLCFCCVVLRCVVPINTRLHATPDVSGFGIDSHNKEFKDDWFRHLSLLNYFSCVSSKEISVQELQG